MAEVPDEPPSAQLEEHRDEILTRIAHMRETAVKAHDTYVQSELTKLDGYLQQMQYHYDIGFMEMTLDWLEMAALVPGGPRRPSE